MNRLLKNNILVEKLHCLWLMAADHILIIRILALAAVYFAIARFGFAFAPGEQVTVIWPAAGVSLASILLFGYRVWPGVFLGSFLSKLSVHLPILASLGVASGNTLEPIVGAWLLHYYVGAGNYLKSLKGIFGLWFFAAFISTAICAALGVTVLCLSGLQAWAMYEPGFLTWWLADAGGAFIITPLLLAWGCGSHRLPPLPVVAEAVALFVVAIAAGAIIFVHPAAMGAVRVYPHMIFPLMTWAAIRFGQRTVTLMILAVCSAALWTATHHTGFFAPNVFYLSNLPTSQALILTQTYTMVVAVIGLTIYAAMSELREAEKQSRENLQYLQDVIDHIPDPLLIKNRQLVLTGGNKALWEILNSPPEKLIGSTCDDLYIKKEEAQSFNEKYEKVFKTGETSVSEEVFTDHTGRQHILSLKAARINNEKKGPSLVAVARDITALKETENLLLKYTHDLESKNRELDDFAYVASHDLKEPLRGMNIVASLLIEDYRDKLDAEIVKRLQRLTFLSQHMTQLVNNLLHFSQLGHSEPVLQEADPNQSIAIIQNMIEPLLKEKNASIVTPRTLPGLVCDKAGLEEILRNLIINAIKYNDKDSKVVEVGMFKSLNSPRGPESNVFYVKDNGIGIDPDYHQIIFRLFKRLPSSVKYDESGTGMGLTFIRKIIERNNGYIWLESEPGKGTTFYFTLGRQAFI